MFDLVWRRARREGQVLNAAAEAVESDLRKGAEPPLPPEEPKFRVEPQEGPQTAFAASTADIAIIGGGAYGGKSFALLMEPLTCIDIPTFSSVAFRRETPQLRMPGGLWDEAKKLYRRLGAHTNDGPMVALWPSGAVSKFWHLQYDDSVLDWDSSQVPLLIFDQLESFSEQQFFYMLSRNRDPSGRVKPWVRAACNPRHDSWLKRFLSWWIDSATGYAIPERSGIVRWMIRVGDDIVWADSREELWERYALPGLPAEDPKQPRPMSVTFIVARIWDNKIGLERDPGYVAKLMAMAKHERERLLGDEMLGGNWNARATAGSLFRREWCQKLGAVPADVEWCRGWDLAGTKPHPGNPNPDWTVGVRVGRYRGRKRFVIAPDVKRLRDNPGPVQALVERTASDDGVPVVIRIPQDPGQAGKAQAKDYVAALAGYVVRTPTMTGDKVVRFSPFSVQAEAGNVDYVDGIPEDYLAALEGFPEVGRDDADATSEAFTGIAGGATGDQVLDYFRNIGAGPKVRLPGDAVTEPKELPPALTRGIAGVADAVELAREITAGVPAVAAPGSRRLLAAPHQSFMFGAGRRYSANAEGYLTAESDEDLLVLLRSGCQRAPAAPETAEEKKP